MSYVMSYSGIPAAISEGLMSVSNNRYMIILIMNVFLLVMGMFLDLTPAVLIFTPIFLPIATSVGMSPVHFGLMLIMNLGIGSVTPPVGSCLFVGCGVGRVKIEGLLNILFRFYGNGNRPVPGKLYTCYSAACTVSVRSCTKHVVVKW